MNSSYFKDKRIWVTGASSGIGKEISQQLSNFGIKQLIISGRNYANLEQVKSSCNPDVLVKILAFDMNNREEIAQVLQSNSELIQQIDLVIHNAGVSMRSLIEDTSLEVYDKMMQVNCMGAIQITQFILPSFQKRKSGHFVVMSSMAGKFGVPWRSGYSASKMALQGYFNVLRAENVDNHIDVTIISPGFIKTDISKHALTGDGTSYNKMDSGQKNGMEVRVAVAKMLKNIAKKKSDFLVGGFKETTLAFNLNRFFPALFRKIISKSNVK